MSTGIDPHAILAGLGVETAVTATPVAGGFGGGAIWRVTPGGGVGAAYALRLFSPGDEGTFLRERAAMDGVRRQGLPVPAVRAADLVDGHPAMLLDWCAGRTILEELMHRPHRAWSLGMLMGRLHGNLHLCAVDAGLREHGHDWIAWAGPEETALRERVRRVCDRDARRATVLHLDLHPANVLVRAGRVTGLIDWANAGAGDARADVARTDSILRFAPIPAGVPREPVLRLRRLFRRGWRLAHRRIIGDVTDMEVFDAWALAVMLRDLGAKLDWADPVAAGVTAADLAPIREALGRRKSRLGLG